MCVCKWGQCVWVCEGGESCGWVQVKPEIVGSNKDGKRCLIMLICLTP